MISDQIAGPSGDALDDIAQSLVLHIGRAPTARADQMMVVIRPAGDVSMLARGQVEPLEQAELHEQIERAEDGRPTDATASCVRVRQQIGRREVPGLAGHQTGHHATWSGQATRAALQGREEGLGLGHRLR